MKNRLNIALIASTLALGFVGAAAATQRVSGHTSPMSAQQAGFMPVPLCPPSAPSCPIGGPPDKPSER
jgi:hypothetical protein